MKTVIQRVSKAAVQCESSSASIGRGLCVLFGAVEGDGEEQARLLARKVAALRIFADENGKMNLSVQDVGGEILVVPNFTLAADSKKGNRPSFIRAAQPETAIELFELFKSELVALGASVKSGVFKDNMAVELTNDGPITIIIDTEEWNR